MNDFEKLKKRIDSFKDSMVDMQIKLTAIPALSPSNGGEGEYRKAEFLKNFLKEIEFDEIKEINAPDPEAYAGIRPNLVALYRGKHNKKTIWIMTHMDIVPPGELSLWTQDPYKAWIENGKIFGRGVEDNQQEMIASLFAIKAFKEEKITPNCNVGIVLVSDEETGSEKGIIHVLKTSPDIFKRDDLIIVPDAGNPDGTMIEVAEKSILWLKFKVIGKQTHGSRPHTGINSFKAGANLIVKLDNLYGVFGLNNPIFDPPVSTFEPTKKEPNVPNVNTIPGEDVFYFDCRVLPEFSLEDVEKKVQEYCEEIEKKFGVKISFSSVHRLPSALPTPSDAPVVQALKKAIKDVYGKDAFPVGIGGGTVAAYFRKAGHYVAVWSKMEEMAHQPNEYCIIENMVGDSKIYANLFLQE